jgi:hypothetical protein
MKPALRRHRQRGVALMAMLAVLILGATWWTVTALSNSVNRTAEQRAQNAQVLQQAKSALMGWVAHQAAMTTEADPGRLPCPEPAANIGTANQGTAAPNCALPAVGRLPWRTLGLDQLRDAAGEPVWYVVSPNWTLDGVVANTVINSNSIGALQLDNTGDVVALIIAPGAPLNVTDAACTPRNQMRAVPGNLLDYLECANVDAAPNVFASSGPTGSFNDQVLALTGAELLPVIESAVAARLAREFGPSMRYCGTGAWPACDASAKFPFAATFVDPSASNFLGVLNNRGGLPPLSFSAAGPCVPAGSFCSPPASCDPAADNRCVPNLVTYQTNPTVIQTPGGGATLRNYDCSASTTTTISCTLNASHSIFTAAANRWFEFTIDITSNNVGLALRDINAAVQMTGVDTAATNPPLGYSVSSAALNADGSATVRVAGRVTTAGGGFLGGLLDSVCGLDLFSALFQALNNCNGHVITIPFMWVDEPMLYATNATLAWFYRNNWHQNMYYAVSQDNAPSGDGACSGATCLTANGTLTAGTNRALLVVPGRALPLVGQARPPAVLTDWLEGVNATAPPNATFGRFTQNLTFNRTFNDRVVVIEANP